MRISHGGSATTPRCSTGAAGVRPAELAAVSRGAVDRTGSALVHPGKLADGLRSAAVAAPACRIYEGSAVRDLQKVNERGRIGADPGGGAVNARRVLLATSAYPPLLRAIGRYVAPCLRLRADERAAHSSSSATAIGWNARQGVGDIANQFHYYRLSADDRILWGGYDAVYRYGGPVGAQYDGLRADVRQALPALLHDVSTTRGSASSPTDGAARSTRAAVSRCSSARRSAAGSSTHSATPGSALARAASARGRVSISSTAAPPRPEQAGDGTPTAPPVSAGAAA